MRTPAGTECRHYYEDFNRGRQTQECRLIKANRHALPWQTGDCSRCAVPAILKANAGRELKVDLTVIKRWGLFRRLRVDAYCLEHDLEVREPMAGCPRCVARERGDD